MRRIRSFLVVLLFLQETMIIHGQWSASRVYDKPPGEHTPLPLNPRLSTVFCPICGYYLHLCWNVQRERTQKLW